MYTLNRTRRGSRDGKIRILRGDEDEYPDDKPRHTWTQREDGQVDPKSVTP